MKTIGAIMLFFLLSANLAGQETNLYQSIVKRNAFDLTGSAPIKTLPPATNILAPYVFLTGITRFNNTNKINQVHLVLKKIGKPDEFISLLENQTRNGIQLKKVEKNSALITLGGKNKLLSFEKHSLPTVFTKAAAVSKTSRQDYTSKLMQMSKDKKYEKKDAKKYETRGR